MRELTQTSVGLVGNCWQTAVACILEIDPDEMPAQAEYDKSEIVDGRLKRVGSGYNNVLQTYLQKHQGLAYVELHVPTEAFDVLRVQGYHLMTGTTVRSEQLGGMRHVVVGKDGQQIWDPHPSRAGLLDEIHWALLTPYPKSWSNWRGDSACACPRCRATAC